MTETDAPGPVWERMRLLVAEGVVDAELGALLWLLAERGVAVVVAGRDRALVQQVADALPAISGTLAADSLDEVARLAGGSASAGLPDEMRDMGVMVIVRTLESGPRVVAAHYVRPLERDAGGHVQRRGPAVLAAWDEGRGEWDHFAWGVESELAERAGMSAAEFAAELDQREQLARPPGRS